MYRFLIITRFEIINDSFISGKVGAALNRKGMELISSGKIVYNHLLKFVGKQKTKKKQKQKTQILSDG
jgi:hypothetical protein